MSHTINPGRQAAASRHAHPARRPAFETYAAETCRASEKDRRRARMERTRRKLMTAAQR